MDLRETYNIIAEDWHREYGYADWPKKGRAKFVTYLNPGGIVLDVGCGGGTTTKFLLENGMRVVGVDLSENMIEIAKREAPQAEFHICDLRDIEKIEGVFDGILAQAVLLHIPKKEISKSLEKLVSKLKNGGYLCVFMKERKSNGPEEEIEERTSYGKTFRRFFSYFTTEELRKLLIDAGLENIFEDIIPVGHTRWIQIIAKKP